MRTRSIATQEKWRGIIHEQTNSGQTVAQYCRQRGIAASSLFAWKRRLAGAVAASTFVEARLKPPEGAGGEAGSGIEIHLPRQRRIVVQRGFDGAALGEVIQALEALP